jgi:ABC-2 type transport system ATP-binding protein
MWIVSYLRPGLRVQGWVDEAYRDELVARFELDPGKKVRAYSKGTGRRSS